MRLMIYDRNASAGRLLVLAWRLGAWLYLLLGRLDDWYGAASWSDALEWLATHRRTEPLREVQFWGHGKFGEARIGGEVLDATAVTPKHPLHARLYAVRERLRGEGLWWFRTCSTFATPRGQDFAQRFTDFLGCRTAGHTFIIGPFQSGLHSLAPGQQPSWPPDEGVDGERPLWSKPGQPNTITCLHSRVPAGY